MQTTTTQLTQHTYFKNCAEVSDENFNLLTQQQQTQFTQADTATYNFTIAQAAQAICCYDTEYRETICEQFEDECNNANFATLALRIICNY
jgi:hypothetical protein